MPQHKRLAQFQNSQANEHVLFTAQNLPDHYHYITLPSVFESIIMHLSQPGFAQIMITDDRCRMLGNADQMKNTKAYLGQIFQNLSKQRLTVGLYRLNSCQVRLFWELTTPEYLSTPYWGVPRTSRVRQETASK